MVHNSSTKQAAGCRTYKADSKLDWTIRRKANQLVKRQGQGRDQGRDQADLE